MKFDTLDLSFGAADDRACLDALVKECAGDLGPPHEIRCDPGRPGGGASIAQLLAAHLRDFRLVWHPNSPRELLISRTILRRSVETSRIKLTSFTTTPSIPWVRRLLERLPFTICASGSASTEWGSAGSRIDYPGCGFSDAHHGHGWICAFKGSGHDRLVSRRWLEHGPWRLIRAEGDLSIVQFHDLDTDDETALAQAKPGHERMGISPVGGYIQSEFVWRVPSWGGYESSTQTLLQVVAGREVTQREMLEAAAVRYYQQLEKPVRNVAYVFMDEGEARRHLHELWLRNIEVRALVGGDERRLDEDYHPTPVVPDWVKRLQDRDGF